MLLYLGVIKGNSLINIINYVLGMREFVPPLDVLISNNNIILLSKVLFQDPRYFVFLAKMREARNFWSGLSILKTMAKYLTILVRLTENISKIGPN